MGLSIDKTSKDRVAIAFGISPIAYSFHETLVSVVRPLRLSLTARQNSYADPFDIGSSLEEDSAQDLSESIGGLSIVVDKPCESSRGKQPLRNYASLATLVDEPCESSRGKQPLGHISSFTTLHSKHSKFFF